MKIPFGTEETSKTVEEIIKESILRGKRFKRVDKAPKNRSSISRYKKMLQRVVATAESNDIKTKEGRTNIIKVILEAKEMLRM